MSIQLIPVLEINCYNQNILPPDFKPDIRLTEEWRIYRNECLEEAGCPDILTPFYEETDFYRIEEIPLTSVEWLINSHLKDYLNKEYGFDQLCPLFGGYGLVENDECLLFPQCCGDLSDIIYWKHICIDKKQRYYNGHPAPDISFTEDRVCFYCFDEFDPFFPETKKYFDVDHRELLKAYNSVIPTLAEFYNKVFDILKTQKLPETPGKIAKRLIYENIELGEDKV